MGNRVLIIQRVLTPYRYELFEELADTVDLTVASSKGLGKGALKSATIRPDSKLKVKYLPSLKLGYKGESRGTTLFFFPQVIFSLGRFDTVILEGTTNLLNNFFIVPILFILGKKIVWWDAGYSLGKRTNRRKVIDFIAGLFVSMTNIQFAYSSRASDYMRKYMKGTNCHVVLNTISTSWFEKDRQLITEMISNYSKDPNYFQFLYVGAIEKRKKIDELLEFIIDFNSDEIHDCKIKLIVVGGGNYLNELCEKYNPQIDQGLVRFVGPIYQKEDLLDFYMKSDLFVLPGDGGLAIVQSLLFGLPVVCFSGDLTEFDYLESKFILGNWNDLKKILEDKENLTKTNLINSWQKLYSSNWTKTVSALIND